MFPCLASRETDVEILLFGNKNVFALGQKKYFFSDTNWKFCFQNYCFRNWSFTSQTHVSQFSLHEAILACFQCCSLKMFPSHGERATIMNGWPRSRNSQSHKQVIEKGRKRKEERNWKEEDIELLIAYYIRTFFLRLLRKSVYYNAHPWIIFSEPVCPRLASAAYTAAAKHFVRELTSKGERRGRRLYSQKLRLLFNQRNLQLSSVLRLNMQCEIEKPKLYCRRSRSSDVNYAVSWSFHVVVLQSTTTEEIYQKL